MPSNESPIQLEASRSPGAAPPAHAPLPFLGLACAVGVSSLYYNQPLLLEIAHTFGTTAGKAGFVAVATQVGYAAGILCIVPLGDVLERRTLIIRMFAAVSIALLLVAIAPNLTTLIIGSILMGALASVTHIILPIAPDLVGHAERGRAIGTVMTGLLLGVLLARTFSGWVSDLVGWRSVFIIAAVMNAAFAPLFWKYMPRLPPKQNIPYSEAMLSLLTLFRTQPLLRESSLIGGLAFASFSGFWTTLAFMLNSHYGLGAGVAGSFGIVGAAGAMVAPFAGRFADRKGTRWVLTLALGILATCYVLLWGEEKVMVATALHLVLLVLVVLLLDTGAQMMQVANQTRIFGLDPSARSRINTVYMTFYFGGGALGSALATIAWVHWRWNGVCGLELAFVGLAILSHLTGPSSGSLKTGRAVPTPVKLEA